MDMIDIQKDVFSATDIGLVRKANEDSCGAAETPNGDIIGLGEVVISFYG